MSTACKGKEMRPEIKYLCRVVAVAALLALPLGAVAQTPPAPPKVARGVVESIDDTHLTLDLGDRKTQTLALAKDWTVSLLKPVDVESIQAGSFIGTAEMPAKDGTGRSLEVHVFPPGVKAGEGHYDWDLRKGSMMTNGTVGKVTAGAKGRELQVTYPGGERKVVVPKGVPVVQITGGQRSLVRAGVPVFVMIANPPGAEPSVMSIAVGENGTKPPM